MNHGRLLLADSGRMPQLPATGSKNTSLTRSTGLRVAHTAHGISSLRPAGLRLRFQYLPGFVDIHQRSDTVPVKNAGHQRLIRDPIR